MAILNFNSDRNELNKSIYFDDEDRHEEGFTRQTFLGLLAKEGFIRHGIKSTNKVVFDL